MSEPAAGSEALEAGGFDQPRGGQFDPAVGLWPRGQCGMFAPERVGQRGLDDRVLEEAAGAAAEVVRRDRPPLELAAG